MPCKQCKTCRMTVYNALYLGSWIGMWENLCVVSRGLVQHGASTVRPAIHAHGKRVVSYVMLCTDLTPCAELPDSTSQCMMQESQWSFNLLSMLVNVLSVGYKLRKTTSAQLVVSTCGEWRGHGACAVTCNALRCNCHVLEYQIFLKYPVVQ